MFFSPLGSREALINIDKASPGLLVRWMDGWMDGWMAYLPLKIFRCLKFVFKNIFFSNVFSYHQGERFFLIFGYQQAKNRARSSKMDPKYATFCQVGIRVLANLVVQKVVSWTFSKLFLSCLGSV